MSGLPYPVNPADGGGGGPPSAPPPEGGIGWAAPPPYAPPGQDPHPQQSPYPPQGYPPAPPQQGYPPPQQGYPPAPPQPGYPPPQQGYPPPQQQGYPPQQTGESDKGKDSKGMFGGGFLGKKFDKALGQALDAVGGQGHHGGHQQGIKIEFNRVPLSPFNLTRRSRRSASSFGNLILVKIRDKCVHSPPLLSRKWISSFSLLRNWKL